MTLSVFGDLARARGSTRPLGITSVCSAHLLVIEAALSRAKADGGPALVEATCNQVNQEGGYTGLTPADFRERVVAVAERLGFQTDGLILGGDHLGPNPWRQLEASEALTRAAAMVSAYVQAGFSKIHLDASMGCRGEPESLPDDVVAERAAALAEAAEDSASRAGTPPPVYVIGTEVPPPGGAHAAVENLDVTRPEAARKTFDVHQRAFAARGLGEAFGRVVALVVQPGVEFGDTNVARYRPEEANALAAVLDDYPMLVFEAHSTDYQPADALTALVRDGFAVLKVGPALSFAMREAFYALEGVAAVLSDGKSAPSLRQVMESIMVGSPASWRSHYRGSTQQEAMLRHFSYSDRIRYYWDRPRAREAVARLFDLLRERDIPEILVSQFLPTLYSRVASGALSPRADALVAAHIGDVLSAYSAACQGSPAGGRFI